MGSDNLFIIMVAGLAILASLGMFLLIYRPLLRKSLIAPRILTSVFLEVLVPREVMQVDKEKEPAKEEKEMISIAEQLFATLSHTQHRNISTFLRGHESLSFELISANKKISFVINCPRRLQDLVEKQIHAQYPHAEIDEIPVPNIFGRAAALAAVEIGLQKKYYFPIKTYKNMESDPLNALTNSLSKLGGEEAGAIQIVIAPAISGWRGKVLHQARYIQNGGDFEIHTNWFMRTMHWIFQAIGDWASSAMTKKKQKEQDYFEDPSKKQQRHMLSPLHQDAVKRLEEKAGKSGFETNIRVVMGSQSMDGASSNMRNVLASFMQYNQPPFNGFRVKHISSGRVIKEFMFRYLHHRFYRKMILTTEELASIFHFPTKFTQVPNIKWQQSKRAPAPVNVSEEGILLGINSYRGIQTEIRIARDDRRRHMYIIGRTGTGKSEYMKNMIRQDIINGEGLAVVDPHGDLVDGILEFIPKNRAEDLILFEPFDLSRPMGLNMLEVSSDEEKDFAVQEMIEIFYKLFPPEMIGPMFEHNMRNVMLTLMADKESPGTIAEIPRMFTDQGFQRYKVGKLQDPVVRAFWEQEMAKTSDFHKSEMLGYLISKVGRFVENEMMRNIIGQPHSAFDFRSVMDEGKILLINLSKGKTGEVNSKLLGLIIVSKLQMAALARADVSENRRPDFYLYIDEFQNFVTDSLATILSEARKYRLNLVMAHQYISQLVTDKNTKIRDSVFGNAGTMVSFRIGVEDSELMAKEFAPVFNEYDLVNIDRFNAYIKLMINGTAGRPFNLRTLPPPSGGNQELAEAIKRLSKLKYGRARAEVESEIMRRSALGNLTPT